MLDKKALRKSYPNVRTETLCPHLPTGEIRDAWLGQVIENRLTELEFSFYFFEILSAAWVGYRGSCSGLYPAFLQAHFARFGAPKWI